MSARAAVMAREARTPTPVPAAVAGCPVCAADDATPVGVGASFADVTDAASYLVLRCRACGLLHLDPRPPVSPVGGDARAAEAAARGIPPEARVLAAACGAAWDTPLPRGWDVDLGALERAPTAAYDVVVFPGTLERCADPVAALACARLALRPGGRIVVRAVNAGGTAARLFAGRHWAGYEFPHRRQLFTADALRDAAVRAGLVVDRVTVHGDGRAWARSICHLVADLGRRAYPAARVRTPGPALAALGAMLDFVPTRLGRGGWLEVTLRPR
jgi:SAM-dependent methyltransferase